MTHKPRPTALAVSLLATAFAAPGGAALAANGTEAATQRSPDLTQREVRALLRAKGYRRIRDVRYRKTAAATGYLAIAHYDKVAYRLSVSGTSGKIEAKRRLR